MSSFNPSAQKGASFNLQPPSSEEDGATRGVTGATWLPSLEVKSNDPIMLVDVTGTRVEFYEQEGGILVKAALDLDASLTPIESLRISALIQLVVATALTLPITYIRANSLERHFRFSAA